MSNAWTEQERWIDSTYRNVVYYPGDIITLSSGSVYTSSTASSPSTTLSTAYNYQIDIIYGSDASNPIHIKYHSGEEWDAGTSGYIRPSQIKSGGVQWEFTVTYNANGGSGAPSAQTFTRDTGKITLSSTKPTRTGYTFKGWATSSTATTAAYAAGATYSTLANVTLYAVWSKITYTVSYNANGGSGAPSAQTKTYGVDLTLSSTKPTRTGYTFKTWNTSSDGTGTSYSPGGKYTANAGATLYAQWKINTWSVTYDANGGSGAPSAQTKTYGTALTLSSTKPTRTGYTFKTWNTSSDGTGTSYAPGASYTTNGALKLYAIWTINTWTVSYNANGGTGAPSSQTKTYGTALTLSTTKPTRTGYTFKNWNTAKDGSGTSYAAGASYTGNAALTLYAQWTINTWTVSYNANGGSGAPASQTKTYGQTLTLSSTKPTRTGYTFKGWATSASGAVVYAAGGSYTANAAATLYAVWEIIKLTVTFNAGEGTTSEATRSVNYGSAVGTLPTASKEFSNFLGWYTAATGGTKITSSYTITKDITFYAQYEIKALVHVKVNGTYVRARVYQKSGGTYKFMLPHVKSGGTYRQAIGN